MSQTKNLTEFDRLGDNCLKCRQGWRVLLGTKKVQCTSCKDIIDRYIYVPLKEDEEKPSPVQVIKVVPEPEVGAQVHDAGAYKIGWSPAPKKEQSRLAS